MSNDHILIVKINVHIVHGGIFPLEDLFLRQLKQPKGMSSHSIIAKNGHA